MMLRQNLDRLELDYYRPLGNPSKFLHALLQHFSRCKDEDISPAEYWRHVESLELDLDIAPETTGKKKSKSKKNIIREESSETDDRLLEIKRLKEVARAYHVYQQLLHENNALDFGDLINFTLKLFRERPKILAKYRGQFDYVLVDEFQDTNWAQYELVKLLVSPKNNLNVVGDDDQSIYKFRGASLANILEFQKDFRQAQRVVLTQNYRSAQNILDLAYQFIQQNNPNRLEVKMNEKKSNGGLENISKKLVAQIKESGMIEYILADTQEQEARKVAEKILQLYNRSE